MNTVTVVLCVALGMLAMWHLVLAAAFARMLDAFRPDVVDDSRLPFASVLLPLRGADPSLAAGIARLLDQDYPAYDVHIVIDHEKDPAWDLVHRFLREHPTSQVHVGVVGTRSTTCSPQCSALIQAMSRLDPRSEIVVIMDGDVLTHRSWLRELVAPLLRGDVGVAHGNRWFMPTHDTWGALVRTLWNAGAVVPMHLLGIPWAGSMAIKKSVLVSSGLLELWPRTIVPDAPAKKRLSDMGLRIQFVPSLMMINRENCDLRFSHDFMKRQMLWTRLYHPHWGPVVIHAIVMLLVLAVSAALAIVGIARGATATIAALGTCLLAYTIAMTAAFNLIDNAVRRIAARRGEQVPGGRISRLAKLALAMPLTQLVHASAVLLATVQRHVTWRGITYLIHDAFDITVVDDQPFVQPAGLSDAQRSL